MCYLYGSKKGVARKLVATFDSEPQLLAYVRWATLTPAGQQAGKFEQGERLSQLFIVGAVRDAAHGRQ